MKLSSSGAQDPIEDGDPSTVSGAAYAHHYIGTDRWVECASVCFRSHNGSFQAGFDKTAGAPTGRLAFIPSKLRFGKWRAAFPVLGDEAQTPEDGFLFVSTRAATNGVRGRVKAVIDGDTVAGASVHWFTGSDSFINEQSFCVPVPGNSRCRLILEPTWGTPIVQAAWMPIEDTRFRLQRRKPVPVNGVKIQAQTDGFLHGWISSEADEGRGTLKIRSGADLSDPNRPPLAAAAVHLYKKGDRHIPYGALMLPVKKGTA